MSASAGGECGGSVLRGTGRASSRSCVVCAPRDRCPVPTWLPPLPACVRAPRYLVQNRMVDVLVTTAGGIEEDFIKCMGHTYVGDFALKGGCAG